MLPYLGVDFFTSQNQHKKYYKEALNCRTLRFICQSKTKLSDMFRFKDRGPYNLVSHVIYDYRGPYNLVSHVIYDYTWRYIQYFLLWWDKKRNLKGRSGEHLGISLLTFKKTEWSKESLIRKHFLHSDNKSSLDEFIYHFSIRE